MIHLALWVASFLFLTACAIVVLWIAFSILTTLMHWTNRASEEWRNDPFQAMTKAWNWFTKPS